MFCPILSQCKYGTKIKKAASTFSANDFRGRKISVKLHLIVLEKGFNKRKQAAVS